MRIRLLRLPTIILILLVLVAAPGPTLPPAEAVEPLVLAFYYAWYDQSTWSSGQLSDLPRELYVSADSATIDRHVRQAQSSGIDGFVQSWYGPAGENQTEGNFRNLLDIAAARGFRAAADFEVGSPYFATAEDRVAALRYLLTVHAAHPSYLRVDGRPVVFFWAPQLMSIDQWATTRAQVDPERSSVWIAEGAAIDYLTVFDGLHLYNIAWSESPVDTLASWGGRVRAMAEELGTYRYWVATAMPGWDDTRITGRTGGFIRDRADGDYYRRTWAGAVASRPDMVIVTSFNEWMEGSMIEPSVSYGELYLRLTNELAASYKAGIVPAVGTRPAGTAATQTQNETPTSDTKVAAITVIPAETETVTATPVDNVPGAEWPTPRPDGALVHLVESGDTLLGIANRYGVTLDDLLTLNDLERNAILRIGQAIIIAVMTPTPTPSPTLEPTATSVPAIRQVTSPPPTRRSTQVAPSRTPTPTSARSPAPTDVLSPIPRLTPTSDRTSIQDGELLPWPAITVGLLLVVAIWLLFRRPGSD
jgi:LysM repeat protein